MEEKKTRVVLNIAVENPFFIPSYILCKHFDLFFFFYLNLIMPTRNYIIII